MVFMQQKCKKQCAWGICYTDPMYPERMGNGIYFISFPKPHQNGAKMQIFWLSVSLSYNFHLLKQNFNNILCFSKTKLSNVKVSKSKT